MVLPEHIQHAVGVEHSLEMNPGKIGCAAGTIIRAGFNGSRICCGVVAIGIGRGQRVSVFIKSGLSGAVGHRERGLQNVVDADVHANAIMRDAGGDEPDGRRHRRDGVSVAIPHVEPDTQAGLGPLFHQADVGGTSVIGKLAAIERGPLIVHFREGIAGVDRNQNRVVGPHVVDAEAIGRASVSVSDP